MVFDAIVQPIFTHPTIALCLGITVGIIAYISYSSTPTLVPDLPGPGGLPLVGSLFSRGVDPAETFWRWSTIYGPVFRFRLGNQWTVVVNGADAADELMASPQFATSTLSRPQGWSFAKFIENDPRSITVGSSPPSAAQRSKRLLAIEACQPAILRKYDGHIERVCKHMVSAIYAEVQKNGGVVDPFPIVRQAARNLALSIHFGCSIEEAEHAFNSRNSMQPLNYFRSVHGRLRDFFPCLQYSWMPEEAIFHDAMEVARRRNHDLSLLVAKARERFDAGELPDCMIKVMFENEKNPLTEDEHVSIANSMVSAGIDYHMSHSQLWAIGVLASMVDIQRQVYESVTQHKSANLSESQPEDYIVAFSKEVHRVYDAFRISPPRETVKDFAWRGHFIPAGTTIFLNSFAVNRDPTRFANSNVFNPERYLHDPESTRTLPSYTFGLGRRSCPAMVLAHREVAAAVSALVRWFELSIYEGEHNFDPVGANDSPYGFNQGPKHFRLRCRIRDEAGLEKYLSGV